MKRCFRVFYGCALKAELSKGYWNLIRKLGVATHFSEIFKQQSFEKAAKYMAMYDNFLQIEA